MVLAMRYIQDLDDKDRQSAFSEMTGSYDLQYQYNERRADTYDEIGVSDAGPPITKPFDMRKLKRPFLLWKDYSDKYMKFLKEEKPNQRREKEAWKHKICQDRTEAISQQLQDLWEVIERKCVFLSDD
jgi:hypothetical protein